MQKFVMSGPLLLLRMRVCAEQQKWEKNTKNSGHLRLLHRHTHSTRTNIKNSGHYVRLQLNRLHSEHSDQCLDFGATRAKFEGGQQPAFEGTSPPSNTDEAGTAFNKKITERSRLLTDPGQHSFVSRPTIGGEIGKCTELSEVDQPGDPGQGTRLGQQEVTISYSRGWGDSLAQ